MVAMGKIREGMSVVALDGQLVGTVSRAEGQAGFRVTSVKDGRGFDHFVPLDWVSDVDKYVFLNKSSRFVGENWTDGDGRPDPRLRHWAA